MGGEGDGKVQGLLEADGQVSQEPLTGGDTGDSAAATDKGAGYEALLTERDVKFVEPDPRALEARETPSPGMVHGAQGR